MEEQLSEIHKSSGTSVCDKQQCCSISDIFAFLSTEEAQVFLDLLSLLSRCNFYNFICQIVMLYVGKGIYLHGKGNKYFNAKWMELCFLLKMF